MLLAAAGAGLGVELLGDPDASLAGRVVQGLALPDRRMGQLQRVHGSKSHVRHAPPVAWQASEIRLITSALPPGRTRQATTRHAGVAPDE